MKAWVLLLAAIPVACAGPVEGTITALTYNVHGLPSVITGDDTPGRIARIGPLLNAYDLVGLQEDFDDRNHAVLVAASQHREHLRFSDALARRIYGSGLSILSRYAIVAHRHVHYSACHGRFTNASDCLASKGFQAARVRLAPGIEIDVYNSHLEAGGGDGDDAARAVQVEELMNAMNTWSAGRALILLADTNLRTGDPVEAVLLDRLLAATGLEDACDAVGCAEPGRIDRIMLRSSEVVELTAVEWFVDAAFVDAAGRPLSDHDAIASTIRWRRRHYVPMP